MHGPTKKGLRAFLQGEEADKVEKNLDWIKSQGEGAFEKPASTMGQAGLRSQGFTEFSTHSS